jgi:hypothetical protein
MICRNGKYTQGDSAVHAGKALRLLLLTLFGFFAYPQGAAQKLPDAPSTAKAKPATPASQADKGWPRTFSSSTDKFTLYQPQIEKWDGNRLYLYSAVEVTSAGKASANYGVVWFNARTEVDKVNRTVLLDQVELTKVNFPADAGKNDELSKLLEPKLPSATKTISLDRVIADLQAAERSAQAVEGQERSAGDHLLQPGSRAGAHRWTRAVERDHGNQAAARHQHESCHALRERQEEVLPAGDGLVAAIGDIGRVLDLCEEAA